MDQRGLGTFLFIASNVFYVIDETSQQYFSGGGGINGIVH